MLSQEQWHTSTIASAGLKMTGRVRVARELGILERFCDSQSAFVPGSYPSFNDLASVELLGDITIRL